MTNEELVKAILENLGGVSNIVKANNCMTRLRISVKDDSLINGDALRAIEDVRGTVQDRAGYIEVVVGPGKSRKCADICAAMGIPAEDGLNDINEWNRKKVKFKERYGGGRISAILKSFGEIFVPLLPGIIAAGLCSGIASLIAQIYPGYIDNKIASTVEELLVLINTSFLTYLTAWAGYRAAEKFGGTPILGGMLGMITTLGGIDSISQTLGLFNWEMPLDSILRSGRGGVLAAVIGVYFMVKIEKLIRKIMPESVDIIFTPLLTLIFTLVPYILLIMPAMGIVSTGLVWIVEQICMSSSIFVRMIAGYISAALFLPLVAMGMHHGLVALYTVQLEEIGYVTLYPALAMAGAGQVGAAIAIYLKARKAGNDRILKVIKGALPAGFLGVGEPLIYGVTLPMGKPFITAGLGAGFGGAFVMAMQVASTTWGPSGLMAGFIMTAGPAGPALSVANYFVGLVISYIMGFIITSVWVSQRDVSEI